MEITKSNNDEYDIEEDINRIIQGEIIYEDLEDISSTEFESETEISDKEDCNELENEDIIEETEEEKEISGGNEILNNEWNLWYHFSKNDWTINSYKTFNMSIKTIRDFWRIFNNLDKLGGIKHQHFFLMRENIEPTWEHKKNRRGGSWSIKISGMSEKEMENKVKKLWEKICVSMIGETLTKYPTHINGVSLCLKNFSLKTGLTYVIKIWNDDCKHSSLDLLPNYILDDFKYNIIYKAHIPEDI